jgi:YesN/AraC family two-component response regulator
MHGEDYKKFNNVYQYIINNFKEDTNLNDVASVASMTLTSFPRYFKNRMRESFSQFVIDLKIGYAYKLLLQNQAISLYLNL